MSPSSKSRTLPSFNGLGKKVFKGAKGDAILGRPNETETKPFRRGKKIGKTVEDHLK